MLTFVVEDDTNYWKLVFTKPPTDERLNTVIAALKSLRTIKEVPESSVTAGVPEHPNTDLTQPLRFPGIKDVPR